MTNRVRLGWRIGLTLLLLGLLMLYTLVQGGIPAGAQSSGDPLVLAFYYPWYDESTWSGGRTADLPSQPYVSSDRAAMGRQIEQAKAAGVDAFVVAWYGPGGGNPTESNLAALLEEAAARNFRIAILLETNSPFLGGSGDVAAALEHAQRVHAAQPAYLRVDGKPVVFVWQTGLYGQGAWQSIRDQVDPERAALWIADGTDTTYLSLFDGHYLYSNTWNPAADLEAVDRKYGERVASARATSGAAKYWVATVMPGYDDVKARGGFAQDREGGAYYDRSWAAALASDPNWVVVTSFNEWMEGSQIEPSVSYGEQYLTQTAGWSSQFKAGGARPNGPAAEGAADDAAEVVAVDAAADAAQGAPVDASAAAEAIASGPATPSLTVATPLLNIRAGPGEEFPIVGTAAQGETLTPTGMSSAARGWWQVAHIGQQGWVSADLVEAAGPVENLPDVEASAPASQTSALTAAVVGAASLDVEASGSEAGGREGEGAQRVVRRGRGPVLSPRP